MRVEGVGVVLGREGVRSGEKWITRARGDGIIAVLLVSLLLRVWWDNTAINLHIGDDLDYLCLIS